MGRLEYHPSESHKADIFTKALKPDKFRASKELLNVRTDAQQERARGALVGYVHQRVAALAQAFQAYNCSAKDWAMHVCLEIGGVSD
eukprot:6349175-Amphidinium_carterae.1